jgi:transposase
LISSESDVERNAGLEGVSKSSLRCSGRRVSLCAWASWTQTLTDWIDAHVRAFAAIGGVPHLLVPDDTKTAVIKACLYDPLVNRTYADMATHYDTAILPARPRRPRDKAKFEQAVLVGAMRA